LRELSACRQLHSMMIWRELFVSRGTAILFDVKQLLIRTCDTFKTTKRLNRDSIRID
jgi:hypothetical protein